MARERSSLQQHTPTSRRAARSRRIREKRQIEAMLAEIGDTPTGAAAVAHVRAKRWSIRYGKPVGGAFTYPWKRISLRRGYSYRQTRAMLAHELGHAWKYPRALVDSAEQEYEAEVFARQVLAELGQVAERGQDAWFRVPREMHNERIWGYSQWHRATLPDRQPGGLRALWYAFRQAVGFLTGQPRRPAGR